MVREEENNQHSNKMADKVENEEEKRQRKEGDPNIEKGKGDEQEE